MQFNHFDLPPRFAWHCAAGCPPIEEAAAMTREQTRARAWRHAERTGHGVIVTKTTTTLYTPESQP